MPRCSCPHCFATHTISADKLGKKGRCAKCREPFVLIEDEPAPVAVVAAPPVLAPAWTPPVPPVEIPPVGAVAASPPEVDWATALDGGGDSEFGGPPGREVRRREGHVEPLANRPVLTAIATLLFAGSIVLLLGAVVMFGVAVRVLFHEQAAVRMSAFTVFVPIGGVLILWAVVVMGLSELISLLRGVEVRQHEISQNCAR